MFPGYITVTYSHKVSKYVQVPPHYFSPVLLDILPIIEHSNCSFLESLPAFNLLVILGVSI